MILIKIRGVMSPVSLSCLRASAALGTYRRRLSNPLITPLTRPPDDTLLSFSFPSLALFRMNFICETHT